MSTNKDKVASNSQSFGFGFIHQFNIGIRYLICKVMVMVMGASFDKKEFIFLPGSVAT